MPRSRRFLVVLVMLAVVAACGEEGTPPDTSVPLTALSAAADLRVRFDRLFREHVFVAARLGEAIVAKQKKPLEGAVATFDDIGIALAKELRANYGDRIEKGFVVKWRAYRQLLLTYAIRLSGKKKTSDVTRRLSKFGTDLGLIGATIAPEINETRTAKLAADMIGAVEDVLEALVKKDFARADTLLRTASGRAGTVANIYATGIASDRPAVYPGRIDAAAATFRTTLSALLRDHLSLIALATEGTVAKRSASAKAAAAALAPVVDQAAQQVGAIYGATVRTAFTTQWRRLGDAARSYATAGKDKTKRSKAATSLAGAAAEVTKLFAGANGQVDRGAFQGLMTAFVTKLQKTLDEQVAGDFDGAGAALDAAAGALDTAVASLAEATARRFPKRFLSPGAA